MTWISNKWYLLTAAFFWKTLSVVIYSKISDHSFIPTIYERFKSILYLSMGNENLLSKGNFAK